MSGPAHIRLTIRGIPVQQGSKIAVGGKGKGRARVVDDNAKELGPWRDHVTTTAVRLMAGADPLDGPLMIRLVFSMPKRPSVRRERPHVRPDLDKLTRAVCDSLTLAKVYVDDALITDAVTRKVYAGGPDPEALDGPGVVIDVWTLEPFPRLADGTLL